MIQYVLLLESIAIFDRKQEFKEQIYGSIIPNVLHIFNIILNTKEISFIIACLEDHHRVKK